VSISPATLSVIIVLAIVLIGWARESGLRAPQDSTPPTTHAAHGAVSRAYYDDSDLLEIAIRSSDAVIQNIDASNLAGLASCAMPVALIVVMADKLSNESWWPDIIVVSIVGLALIVTYLGYEWGNRFSSERVRDSIDAATLIAAYVRFGDSAVAEAIKAVNSVAARHRRLRRNKRRFITVGVALFGTALAVFVWARLFLPPPLPSYGNALRSASSPTGTKVVS
jgi:hypothetical protein